MSQTRAQRSPGAYGTVHSLDKVISNSLNSLHWQALRCDLKSGCVDPAPQFDCSITAATSTFDLLALERLSLLSDGVMSHVCLLYSACKLVHANSAVSAAAKLG